MRLITCYFQSSILIRWVVLLKLNNFQVLLCFCRSFLWQSCFQNWKTARGKCALAEKTNCKASTPVKHRCMNLLLLHLTFRTLVLSPVLRSMRHGKLMLLYPSKNSPLSCIDKFGLWNFRQFWCMHVVINRDLHGCDNNCNENKSLRWRCWLHLPRQTMDMCVSLQLYQTIKHWKQGYQFLLMSIKCAAKKCWCYATTILVTL